MDLPVCLSFRKEEAGILAKGERNRPQIVPGSKRGQGVERSKWAWGTEPDIHSQERACWGDLQVALGSFASNAQLEGYLDCRFIS